jgi:hypothetical protein
VGGLRFLSALAKSFAASAPLRHNAGGRTVQKEGAMTEFLSVLISMIFGLGLTHVLAGTMRYLRSDLGLGIRGFQRVAHLQAAQLAIASGGRKSSAIRMGPDQPAPIDRRKHWWSISINYLQRRLPLFATVLPKNSGRQSATTRTNAPG